MVKVGLFFCENVEIIFSAFFIPFPSLALKAGKPIVRRKLSAEPAFAPKIIIVIWQEVKDIMKFWLDMGVDGFREDVITFITKRPGLPNGIPLPIGCGIEHYMDGPVFLK